MTELFGEEWHYPVRSHAFEESHEYTFLLRVVEAIQEALRQEWQQVAA